MQKIKMFKKSGHHLQGEVHYNQYQYIGNTKEEVL